MRHTGLSAGQAKDQKAGTFIGRLNILGPQDGLSNRQYDAAINYLSLRNAYQRAIQAPGAVMDGIPGASSDDVSDAYMEWVNDTKEAFFSCRNAIIEAQNSNRGSNLYAALDYCVVRDEAHEYMLGDLRIVCNALANHFRV